VHIKKCISNYSTYEKLSKNKSCIGCIALHGMAYYIFLKYLRSLEEFRKNPHVKIPPKSPSTNFQRLGKFKNPIFIRKEFFLRIRPTRPSLAHAGPLCTAGCRARARPIPAYAALAYLPKAASSSSLRSSATTPSSSITATWAPPVSFIVSPSSADPKHASPAPHRN
jgi:hypothetical protein